MLTIFLVGFYIKKINSWPSSFPSPSSVESANSISSDNHLHLCLFIFSHFFDDKAPYQINNEK